MIYERIWIPGKCSHSVPVDAPRMPKERKKETVWQASERRSAEGTRATKIYNTSQHPCPACLDRVNRYHWQAPGFDAEGKSLRARLVLLAGDKDEVRVGKRIRAYNLKIAFKRLVEQRKAIEFSENIRLRPRLLEMLAQVQALHEIDTAKWWVEQKGRSFDDVVSRIPRPVATEERKAA